MTEDKLKKLQIKESLLEKDLKTTKSNVKTITKELMNIRRDILDII